MLEGEKMRGESKSFMHSHADYLGTSLNIGAPASTYIMTALSRLFWIVLPHPQLPQTLLPIKMDSEVNYDSIILAISSLSVALAIQFLLICWKVRTQQPEVFHHSHWLLFSTSVLSAFIGITSAVLCHTSYAGVLPRSLLFPFFITLKGVSVLSLTIFEVFACPPPPFNRFCC